MVAARAPLSHCAPAHKDVQPPPFARQQSGPRRAPIRVRNCKPSDEASPHSCRFRMGCAATTERIPLWRVFARTGGFQRIPRRVGTGRKATNREKERNGPILPSLLAVSWRANGSWAAALWNTSVSTRNSKRPLAEPWLQPRGVPSPLSPRASELKKGSASRPSATVPAMDRASRQMQAPQWTMPWQMVRRSLIVWFLSRHIVLGPHGAGNGLDLPQAGRACLSSFHVLSLAGRTFLKRPCAGYCPSGGATLSSTHRTLIASAPAAVIAMVSLFWPGSGLRGTEYVSFEAGAAEPATQRSRP